MFGYMLPLTTKHHFPFPKALLPPFKNFPLLFNLDLALCYSRCVPLTKVCSSQILPLWILFMTKEPRRQTLVGSIPDQHQVLVVLLSSASMPSRSVLVLLNPQPGSSGSKKLSEISLPSNEFPLC